MSDQTVVISAPVNEAKAQYIGRYEVREEIGRGGMAAVFKAYDPEIDRPLAIKVLLPELARSSEYRARFLREARGAGLLSHANIVTVFDVGEDRERPYIAMEYVEGGTLADLLKNKEPLPVRAVVEMGIQLARALAYAHQRGIVHRDVKPGNIMLLKDGKTIKVADFGICRIEGGDVTHATRVGDVLGTPNYMSPEQVAGQAVDARTDLFSAGVLLYQLLSGALPFEGETFVSVGLKIIKSEPVPIGKLCPDLPLSLRRVIDRALKKQVERRFQSGDELAQALVLVARELAEAGRLRQRIMPLRIRWSLILTCIVALTMSLAGAFLHQRQSAAMLDQAMSYGAALSKFMAAQAAVPMLSEDWPQIEVFVQESVSRQEFSHLHVVDHRGIIRGSTRPKQGGLAYTPLQGQALPYSDPNVSVQSHQNNKGSEILDFAAPVVFQGRTIGAVHLGIAKAPLDSVARLTLMLLGGLLAITSAAVACGAYFLAHGLAEPLHILKQSLAELALGNFDYRISETRSDDFDEVFRSFDAAAGALQQRYPTPQTDGTDFPLDEDPATEVPPTPQPPSLA